MKAAIKDKEEDGKKCKHTSKSDVSKLRQLFSTDKESVFLNIGNIAGFTNLDCNTGLDIHSSKVRDSLLPQKQMSISMRDSCLGQEARRNCGSATCRQKFRERFNTNLNIQSLN